MPTQDTVPTTRRKRRRSSYSITPIQYVARFRRCLRSSENQNSGNFGTAKWKAGLAKWLKANKTLSARYAHERSQNLIPVQIARGKKITLSPGEHSELIRAIIEDFGARFVPGGVLIYAGDTGNKCGYFDSVLLAKLGVLAAE